MGHVAVAAGQTPPTWQGGHQGEADGASGRAMWSGHPQPQKLFLLRDEIPGPLCNLLL